MVSAGEGTTGLPVSEV